MPAARVRIFRVIHTRPGEHAGYYPGVVMLHMKLVVDVRTSGEFKAGIIPGAGNISLDDIHERTGEFEAKKALCSAVWGSVCPCCHPPAGAPRGGGRQPGWQVHDLGVVTHGLVAWPGGAVSRYSGWNEHPSKSIAEDRS